jgi:maleate isomerase
MGLASWPLFLGVRAHRDDEFQRAQEGIQSAVDSVVGEGAQAVVIGGVPVAARLGYQAEREARRGWKEKSGAPVISGIGASVKALRRLGARRPVAATAYLDEINALVFNYLSDAGLEPVAIDGLRVTSPAEASRVEQGEYHRLAHQLAAKHPEADSVFLGVRGNIQQTVLRLEDELGLPVVHGVLAGLWWALGRLDVPFSGANGGRLLGA